MNILYLCHRIPFPPNKGDKIRSFHQIQYLSTAHDVYLACLVDEYSDFQYLAELERMCRVVETVYRFSITQLWQTASAFLKGEALSVGAFYSPELQGKIDALLRSVRFDRIMCFSSPMAEYVRHIHTIPKIMDFVDLDSEKWRTYADYQSFPFSQLYRLEAERLARYEDMVAHEFQQSVFISTEEAHQFGRRVTDRPVAVVPNGVDSTYFQRESVDDDEGEQWPVLVFTAAMDYFPNIDAAEYFCKTILPLIAKVVPVRFDIVGRNPSKAVRQLAEDGHIRVTGTVCDVRPYLMGASVAVAPLRIARGVQNKVLEAMSMGLPVVGTSNAFQGIDANHEHGIRIADDPQQFADVVITLLGDSVERQRCGQQARAFVQQHCRWEDAGLELEKLLSPVA